MTRTIEVDAGSYIVTAINNAIQEAGEDIVEFGFNGVTVRVDRNTDPEVAYRQWNSQLEENGRRAKEEKDRREHPERHWTKEPPTKPGWYWWRMTTGPSPRTKCVVEVVSVGGKFRVMSSTFSTTDFRGYLTGEWAGPIHEPSE